MQHLHLAATLALAVAFTGCDVSHRSTLGDADVGIGADAVQGLWISTGPSGPPSTRLHWRYLGPAQPSEFRVYAATVTIDTGNRAAHLVTTVTGDARSAMIDIPNDSGLRYAAVEVVSPGSSSLSRNLQLHTDRQLAVISQSPTGNSLHIVRPERPAPELVATRVEAHGWTPGSRAFTYVDILTGAAGIHRVAPPPSNQDLLTAPVQTPEGEVGRHWTSMRVSSTGSVAFHRPVTGGQALEVRDPVGRTRRISGQGEDVRQFAWAPDGLWLSYLRPGAGLRQHLQVVRADGSERTRISPDLGPDEYVFLADWSDDSRHIAFQVVDANDVSRGALYVHDTGTHETIRVAVDLGLDLVWSPDGANLLFSGPGPTPGSRAIYLLPVPWGPTREPTDHIVQLAASATDVFGFDWSPDGERVAYFRKTGPATKALEVIAPLAPQTSYEIELPAGEQPLRAQWSADSRHLACLVQRSTEQALRVFEFGTMTAKVPSTVWAAGTTIGHFEWSPLGRDLAFIMRVDPTFRLYLTRGAALIDLTPDASPGHPVLDFRWSDWAMPRQTFVFSPLVIK